MAATRAVVLQIVSAGSTWEFDVQGVLSTRINVVHNEAGDVTDLRHEWVVEEALIRTADGTAESAWDRYHAFIALIEARDGSDKITAIKIVRDPDGSPATELDLSDSLEGWEQLRVEEVRGGGVNEISPAAVWNTVVPISLTISARKRNADTNGITDVVQQVTNSFENGLHRLQWLTTIKTKNGVDAVAKAKEFAAIDFATYGTYYGIETNSDWGITWDEIDPDYVTDGGPRVVTEVRALSIIQEYGVEVGTTGAGSSPDRVEYVIRDRVTRDETIRAVYARAEGPGAQAWVLNKKPAGTGIWSQETTHGKAGRMFEATWERKTVSTPDPVKDATLISVEIKQGARQQRWEPTAGGFEPVLLEGGFRPWEARVTLQVQFTGDAPTATDMPLPGELPGWIMDREASSETEPELLERATERSGDRWQRTAKLTYRRGTKPTQRPLEAIRNAKPVVSYVL